MGTYKNGREALEALAKEDECLCGDPEVDGMSRHVQIWAETARDMLKDGKPYDDVGETMRLWVDESTRRWRESKFFKLYQTEGAAGFAARGWEM